MSAKTKTTRKSASSLWDELVPPSWLATDYLNRSYPTGETTQRDVDILALAKKMRMNTLIYGPTGPGKTSCVLAYCAEFGIPFYSVSCNGAVEPRQLFGSYVPTEEAGKYVWQDGPVTTMVRNGGVLLLNEVNFMPPRIAAALYSLTDKRRTLYLMEHNEVIVAHDDFQVIADFNPDYEGTRPLNEAFKNRFAVKLYFDYDTVIEQQLVNSDALLRLAGLLRASHKVGDLVTPISTNMLMEFEDIVEDIGLEFAVENFLNAFALDERASVQEVIELQRISLESDFLKDDDSDGTSDLADDEFPYTPEDLKLMTLLELKDIALDYDIVLPGRVTKAIAIVTLIEHFKKSE